ncbi:transcriptional regulator [Luteipulveratus mongoliensis]|uniref:Transcriptional regulator n=1 Tax=Luteipulveratus mongoliensis TaxID=571913 RepID=A0A0K1JQI0_9MICO|nr:transcriptional regulator [Luteipulveratus mongoliensis]
MSQVILQPTGNNVFEATVGQLATAIRLGVFADGEQLPPERELAEQLSVSRMTLRDAISALREAGLVETRRGRGGGTVVTYDGPAAPTAPDTEAASPQRLNDVLSFRRVVESGAAELAADQALDGSQRAWLVECVDHAAATVGSPAYRVADARLHLAVASLCGSSMLISAVRQAQAALGEMLALIPVLPRNIEHSQTQHDAVVRCILAGDAAGAREAMIEHCDATAELLQGLLG